MPQRATCHFAHTFEESQIYSVQALDFLSRFQLPPNPACFAVAYDFECKRNPALHHDLQRILARKQRPDEQLIGELFETHFQDLEDMAAEERLGDLRRLLVEVMRGIARAGKGAGEYGRVLETQLRDLQHDPGPEDLRRIAETLIQATERATTENRALQRDLAQARKESDQLHQELRRIREQALTDGLTSLLNRRALDVRLEALVKEAHDNERQLSVLMLDIDHFKRFNDQFGHAIGDEVIRRVAVILRKQIRGNDLAARYGGEEFVVVLPQTALIGALTVAGSIHKSISRLSLIRKGSQERLPKVTVSMGVANLKPGETPNDLLERADRAMYWAKNHGRNRVVSERQLETDGG